MPARVSPTDRVRAKIDELFASDRELPEILEEVARLGAQLLMQAALEAEVPSSSAVSATNAPRPRRMRSPGRAMAIGQQQSRPPPARSPWSGPSCVVRPPRSPHVCSASTSPKPMPWNRW